MDDLEVAQGTAYSYVNRLVVAGDHVCQLTAAADELGVTFRIFPEQELTHGERRTSASS
jgi:hypothetical protein